MPSPHLIVTSLKDRVVEATTALFSHGPQPLEHTLDHAGDPGLLGPESVSWRVIGDAAAFVGGIRALVVQTAHPEVVAGVEDHSRYRQDPLGRLSRTSFYVTETTYGARPEVDAAVAGVRRAHRPVHGRSARGRTYAAGQPELAAWVHNVLTDSFLAAYQAYGPSPLSPDEADRFVEEQTRIGRLLDADPLPDTAESLRRWIVEHPALERSAALAQAIDFLRDPPLSLPVKIGYRLLFDAAVGTLPDRIGRLTGLESSPARVRAGAATVRSLRWALGSSPSWQLSLVRAGAPIPPGVFRQPLPPRARELVRAS
jgi:uncharacterized protein (DUF2236 family)